MLCGACTELCQSISWVEGRISGSQAEGATKGRYVKERGQVHRLCAAAAGDEGCLFPQCQTCNLFMSGVGHRGRSPHCETGNARQWVASTRTPIGCAASTQGRTGWQRARNGAARGNNRRSPQGGRTNVQKGSGKEEGEEKSKAARQGWLLIKECVRGSTRSGLLRPALRHVNVKNSFVAGHWRPNGWRRRGPSNSLSRSNNGSTGPCAAPPPKTSQSNT